MKISFNKVSTTPLNMSFSFCVYGSPDDEVKSWADYWGFKLETSGPFTNIIIQGDYDLEEFFESPKVYEFVDGFSPNLNKHLHIGHLSNLIIAKAFQSLGIGKEYIAMLGDTLDGSVSSHDAFVKFQSTSLSYDYIISGFYMASDMVCNEELIAGKEKYEGTTGWNIDGEYVVGIKSTGDTTYFYQDVALAENLSPASTLYITGLEQEQHFAKLKKMFDNIEHVPLGLVTAKGAKMSSREGNVIFADEVIDLLLEEFDSLYLAYNIIAGMILSSSPKSMKKIDMDQITNVKTSPGLYFSYTAARLKSAGIENQKTGLFNSDRVGYAYLKALHNKNPKALVVELNKLCKRINVDYGKYRIKDNPKNKAIFVHKLNDLELGMKKLGMFLIDKV